MTRREPPRLALRLLERMAPDRAPLAGDLLEEFARGRSAAWFWWQVLAAVVTPTGGRDGQIRPLQLVDLQPSDAVDRTRQLTGRFRPVNLTASPVHGIGGLGLVALSLLITLVVPGTWWVLLASMLAGVLLGVLMIAVHRHA